jgi:splicing factor 3A subunit 3
VENGNGDNGNNKSNGDQDPEQAAAKVESIDLSGYTDSSELEKAVDGEKLKTELARLGLKCGGTVSDRAKRLFLTKDTPLDQLPAKVFSKKPMHAVNSSLGGGGNGSVVAKNERRVDIVRREAIVTALLSQLRPTLEATIRRTDRRQTQTLKEREREVDEELYGSEIAEQASKKQKSAEGDGDSDDSDDEDDAPVYNPKNIPLDWDGKPMPYWLYKLHGLQHYYDCQICGEETYRGRRNFELHFGDQKHALGMKSLGIPNTKHFHGVTKIDDAIELWKSLQGKLQDEQFDGTKEEEYEDSHGNVLSRTTYEDLARQGLL